MIEDREALLAHFQAMRVGILAAIQGLSESQMTEPTLDGWSVKDHLAHLALWDDMRAQEVRRISAGHDSGWRMSEEQVVVYNDLSYDLRKGMSLAQVMWELENSRASFNEAIRAATPRGLDGTLFGEAALRSTHEAAHTEWITRWRGEKGY